VARSISISAFPWLSLRFARTALPWYVVCALRNPDFLQDFFWHHNFERYLTPVFEHPQPFWFFGYVLLLALIPWIGVLYGVLRHQIQQGHMNPTAR